jgi:hypothetical protein
VAALPSAYVLDPALRDAVRGVVAWSSGVSSADVAEDMTTCNGVGEATCAERFTREVMGFNGDLARDLAPLAHHLTSLARNVGVSAWTPAPNGVAMPGAVTLHGLAGDHLVGIVVFR